MVLNVNSYVLEGTATNNFLPYPQRIKVSINPDEEEITPPTTTSITTTSLSILKKIESLFVLHERPGVLDFLSNHPFLADVLIETFFQIKRYFSTATLWLEVSADQDDPRYTQLLVSVVTDLSVEEADTTFQQFIEKWWLDEMVYAQGKIGIVLRFR